MPWTCTPGGIYTDGEPLCNGCTQSGIYSGMQQLLIIFIIVNYIYAVHIYNR